MKKRFFLAYRTDNLKPHNEPEQVWYILPSIRLRFIKGKRQYRIITASWLCFEARLTTYKEESHE